jgi:hypothetical protein
LQASGAPDARTAAVVYREALPAAGTDRRGDAAVFPRTVAFASEDDDGDLSGGSHALVWLGIAAFFCLTRLILDS